MAIIITITIALAKSILLAPKVVASVEKIRFRTIDTVVPLVYARSCAAGHGLHLETLVTNKGALSSSKTREDWGKTTENSIEA